MRIFLIRHASTSHSLTRLIGDDNLDLSLTKNWKSEVKNIVRDIENSSVSADKIFVSSSKRAIETAKAIFPDRNYQIIQEFSEIDKGFDKFLIKNQNRNTLTLDEWEKIYNNGEINEKLNFIYPSGITINKYISKITKKFLKLIKGYKTNIAIVSHNGPIKAILTEVLGGSRNLYFNLEIYNGKYSEIKFENGQFKLLYLNR